MQKHRYVYTADGILGSFRRFGDELPFSLQLLLTLMLLLQRLLLLLLLHLQSSFLRVDQNKNSNRVVLTI